MKLIYLTLPLGFSLALAGLWMISVASRALPPTSPSSGLEPKHPVTVDMAREAGFMADRVAPDFSLTDTTGKTWDLASLSSGKPLYMIFILDGCPCSTDAEPLFHELYKRYKGQINFVGVMSSTQSIAAKWAKEHVVPYTVLADPDLKVIHAYGAKHSVYNVLILPDRKIDRMWPGYSQDMLLEVNAHMAKAAGLPQKPFDPLYAPLKLSSGCFFPVS